MNKKSLLPRQMIKIHSNMRSLRVVALILAIAALLSIPSFIAKYNIKAQAIPTIVKKGLSPTIEQIPAKTGEVLVGNSSGKKMYIDTSSLNIRIEDNETGARWNSIYDDGKTTDYDKSPLIIKFLGKDSQIYEWTAFKYCISNAMYTINKIENGVQVIFDFAETDSFRLNEYMPQKISIERYQEAFLDKLDQKISEGSISDEKAQRYKSALGLVYEKDKDKGYYFNKFSGAPSASVVTLLIELSKDVGYTREMLIQDSEAFGITVNIVEPARFKIVMEAALDDDDFVIRIPTYEILSENDFYTLQNIVVYPSFGLASSLLIDDGYIMVPDGAGALFKLNTFNDKYPEYTRPVYDNTYFDKLYTMPKLPEDITMPVFGMMYGNGGDTMQGFMGIIEEGAQTAYINVRLGTKDTKSNGTPYNKVFVSFDSTQYSRVKVFGPYSTNDARYLAMTGLIDMDFSVRYKLFPKNASYFNMAIAYKNYLINENNIEIGYENKPKLFLEVISSLSLTDRFLGVPYSKTISMTTYDELANILKDMKGINKVISYNGMYNDGINGKMLNKTEGVSKNGSSDELKKLKDYISLSNDELYFGIDMMKVYKKGNGFDRKKHALYGFNGKPVEVMGYNPAIGRFSSLSNSYYIISPKYLGFVVDGFIKDTEDSTNIYLNDMGSTFYANYNPREIIDPIKSNIIVNESLENLAKSKILAINNPNADRIAYGKYAVNISRESSDYGTMYSSIPFRQLVLNGLTKYTTLNVNMSSDRNSYYILQALELGSYPKFTICSKNVDILQNTDFSDYFSMEYSKLRDTISNVYDEYKAGFEKIGTTEITSHYMLQENVFATTYASGTIVIVNYNKFPVTVGELNIEALGYHIDDSSKGGN